MRRTTRDNLILVANRPIIPMNHQWEVQSMSANQVVLHFDKQEDALLSTFSQFGYVSRRASPSKRRSDQGCARDFQSQLNHG
jgi:hypothetical protein